MPGSKSSVDPGIVAQRRKEILDAAERCITNKGLQDLKLREVAQESQMSLGNLYNYFQNKEALIEALVERQTEFFLAEISAFVELRQQTHLHEDSIVERHRWVAERLVDIYLNAQSIHLSVYIAATALVNPHVHDCVARANQKICDFIMNLKHCDLTRPSADSVPLAVSEAQIALSRTYLEALRGAAYFNPNIDISVLREVAIERLVIMFAIESSCRSFEEVRPILESLELKKLGVEV